jgi:hypothetical protein
MHDPYDDEDDGYDDDHYDHDYNDQYDPYKFYFKFDITNTPLSDWIQKTINDMLNDTFDIKNVEGFPVSQFPVNSWNPNTANNKKFQYLGSNYAGEQIWKTKYFAFDPINAMYKLHLQSHAGYFIKQPNYYKGLFDILN